MIKNSAKSDEKMFHKSEFFTNLNPSKASTPKRLKKERHNGGELNLETITFTKPEVQEIYWNDHEPPNLDDSEPFDFDKECSNGLVEEIDSYENSECMNTSTSEKYCPDEDSDEYNTAEVEYIPVCDILVMIIPQHSTSCFDGLMTVKVLLGEVEVLGHTINIHSGTKELFSPRGCSRLYIKNKGNHVSVPQGNIFSNLPEDLNEIVKRIKPTDSVLLCQNIKSFQVDFLINHISQQIYPNSGYFKCSFGQDHHDGNSIRVNPKWDEIIDNINKNSRILLAGGKSVGKSTMLRYMVNKLLMIFKEVLVIDLDPGQPEFTVPGCISASVVKEPLFGPNFTHLRKPARCIFVPDIDLSEDADEYIGFVEFLMTRCEDIRLMPTIINHMGLTRGLGLYILSAVVVCVQPTTIIDIRSSRSARNYSENLSTSILCKNADMFKKKTINAFTIPNIVTVNSMSDAIYRWNLEPRLIREMCVLSYFGTMMTKMGMAITDVETCTYIINISAVNLINKEGPIPLNAINANLVALCGSIHNSKCYKCVGWGIVRAINFENQDLYLLTPVTQDDLEEVDTFILGSVTLPASLLMNTSNVNGLIPYVAGGILNKYGELTKRSHIPRGTKRGVFEG